MAHATNFYKSLFDSPPQIHLKLSPNFWNGRGQLLDSDKLELIKPFSEEEVKFAIFDMRSDSAPGPNGFGAKFFQTFWGPLKDDNLSLFQDLYLDKLDIQRLNYGVITLVPKVVDANTIKNFRPICLLNVDYKGITKVLTNRFTPVAPKLIGGNQTGFIKGRNILEGVLILHEVVHELRTKGKRGLILKIDFEKAYDKVNWNFLLQSLRMKGFSSKWIEWIKSFISGGSVAININDEVGPYFQTKKGVRQGDPLSPILFNIVSDMLTLFINRAKAEDQLSGVVPHLIEGGLSICTIIR